MACVGWVSIVAVARHGSGCSHRSCSQKPGRWTLEPGCLLFSFCSAHTLAYVIDGTVFREHPPFSVKPVRNRPHRLQPLMCLLGVFFCFYVIILCVLCWLSVCVSVPWSAPGGMQYPWRQKRGSLPWDCEQPSGCWGLNPVLWKSRQHAALNH